MSALAIEINDAGLVVADDASVRAIEPGFATVERGKIVTGTEARARARRQPRQTTSRFWSALSGDASAPLADIGVNAAELAHAQLKSLWTKVGGGVSDVLLVEKEPGPKYEGITVGPNIHKLGYRGVETIELTFTDHRVPASMLLGGEEGVGFRQMMTAVELGRINISARAVGVARRAFEESIRYAQQRETFGRPIAQHHLGDGAGIGGVPAF